MNKRNFSLEGVRRSFEQRGSDKYIEKLKTCVHEMDYEDADILICEFLEEIGYSKLADVYRNIPKWFS